MERQNTPLLAPPVLFAMLEAAGFRSVDIARRLGVTRGAISNWRSGARHMGTAHHQALADLAISHETQWLMLHRMQGQGLVQQPELGTAVQVHHAPADAYQWMVRSFRAQLDALTALASGDPVTWDCATIRATAQELDGMARALEIIQKDQKETGNAEI